MTCGVSYEKIDYSNVSYGGDTTAHIQIRKHLRPQIIEYETEKQVRVRRQSMHRRNVGGRYENLAGRGRVRPLGFTNRGRRAEPATPPRVLTSKLSSPARKK